MKKLLLLGTLFSIMITSSCKQKVEDTEPDITEPTSGVKLIAVPESFDGKLVRVKGFFESGHEHRAVASRFFRTCDNYQFMRPA